MLRFFNCFCCAFLIAFAALFFNYFQHALRWVNYNARFFLWALPRFYFSLFILFFILYFIIFLFYFRFYFFRFIDFHTCTSDTSVDQMKHYVQVRFYDLFNANKLFLLISVNTLVGGNASRKVIVVHFRTTDSIGAMKKSIGYRGNPKKSTQKYWV